VGLAAEGSTWTFRAQPGRGESLPPDQHIGPTVFSAWAFYGEAVRWNIKVSKETGSTLRSFLGSQGTKRGALSRSIEEAVRWRVFDRTVQGIERRNADTDPDELQKLLDDTVREVRAERRAESPGIRRCGATRAPAAIYRAW
jgi:hypothetical protein